MTPSRSRSLGLPAATLLGLFATAIDFWAARGDVSPPVSLGALLGSGLVLGGLALEPIWLAGLVAGLILPLAHLIAHTAGYADNVSPNTYMARLLMAPVTVGAVFLGIGLGKGLRASLRTDSKR